MRPTRTSTFSKSGNVIWGFATAGSEQIIREAVAGEAAPEEEHAEAGEEPSATAPSAKPVRRESGAADHGSPSIGVAHVAMRARPAAAILGSRELVHALLYRVVVAPETAVHAGESLAGNDSSDASITGSLPCQPRSCSAR